MNLQQEGNIIHDSEKAQGTQILLKNIQLKWILQEQDM